jgi:hypothetical protein|tara:strand:+ start:409 stop:687 length:279 start_codon:yes stop_codon:yes gene_type:complete
MQYYTTLTLATSKAIETANIDLENLYITAKTHLMAQRRNDGAWHVRISDAFDSNMTNISDLPIDLNSSQNHIAELIAGCWDDAWDEKELTND